MAPRLYVEIAFASKYSGAPVWTDVTSKVLMRESPLKIRRGRQNEMAQISPSTLQGLLLDNADGRFTPGNPASPYYPNVKLARMVRVRYLDTTGVNRMHAPLAGNARGWYGDGTPFGLTSSTPSPYFTYVQVVWPATAGARQTAVWTWLDNLTIGQQYTVSADVYALAGQPGVQIGAVSGAWAPSVASTVVNDWQRLTVTFVAAAESYAVGMMPAAATTAGHAAWTRNWKVQTGAVATAWVAADATGTIEYARFTGAIDTWLPAPAPAGFHKATAVTATDRSGRLSARGPTIRSFVEEEISRRSPLAWYPLGEGSDAQEAGNVAATAQPPLRQVRVEDYGAMSWGEDTSHPAGFPAAVFTPDWNEVFWPDGYLLEASLPNPALFRIGGRSLVMEAWLRPALFPPGALDPMPSKAVWLAPAAPATPGDGVGLVVNYDGAARVMSTEAGYSTWYTAGQFTLGQWAHLAMVATTAGTTVYFNGSPTLDSIDTISDGNLTLPVLSIGGHRGTNTILYGGSIAQVAIYSTTTVPTDADIMDSYLAGATGFSGERTDERVARLLRYGGIDPATAVLEAGLSTMGRQDPGGLMDLLREAEVTEAGLLFVGGNDAIQFHSRAHRYSRAPSVTYTAAQIEDNLDPVLDDQFLLNDQKVTRRGAGTHRFVDQPSVDEHGAYSDDLTIATDSDQFAADLAAYRVRRYKDAQLRSPSLTIDLLTQPALLTTTLARELGDRLALSGLPADLPASLSALDIEGIEDTIGIDVLTVAFNTSPARTEPGWFLGQAGKSELGFTTYLAF